ncbi:MAG: glucokinase [Nitrosomonadaceae bacterium]|nr:glucokinase [Nitrosomonadaceae bacterium]
MNRYFVCGDIGGTKTLLQALQSNDGALQMRYEQQYDSRAYAGFSDVLRDFLGKAGMNHVDCSPAAACLAVAGPVVAQRAKLTNLPWLMDVAAIAAEFSIPSVKLINDFEAVALGIEALSESDLVTLQPGKPQAQGVRVALGAGTGMGVAWLTWQGERYLPLPTEAGHMDFAPANELQAGLLEYLWKKFGHVSVERVLSGPGLTDIFNFLQAGLATGSGLVKANMDSDGAAQVTDLALNRKHPIAVKALDLFVEIYGAYAGNLALAGLSRGGVYVAGGIAPKIIGKLGEGGFMQAFCSKGRYSAMMSEIPVHVVMNQKVGLLGAAGEAQRMLSV